MLSRKHYIQVANIIRTVVREGGDRATCEQVVAQLQTLYRYDNDRFDRTRFYNACFPGGQAMNVRRDHPWLRFPVKRPAGAAEYIPDRENPIECAELTVREADYVHDIEADDIEADLHTQPLLQAGLSQDWAMLAEHIKE